MMKSLKYCDLQTESARQPLYQYRAATIHHRLASMYHSCFRNQVWVFSGALVGSWLSSLSSSDPRVIAKYVIIVWCLEYSVDLVQGSPVTVLEGQFADCRSWFSSLASSSIWNVAHGRLSCFGVSHDDQTVIMLFSGGERALEEAASHPGRAPLWQSCTAVPQPEGRPLWASAGPTGEGGFRGVPDGRWAPIGQRQMEYQLHWWFRTLIIQRRMWIVV